MPELPEVETSCRGIQPHIVNQRVREVHIRNSRLRWPVSSQLKQWVEGNRVVSVERRAKYILIHFEHGFLVIHLGMSGNLRILPASQATLKHDHVIINFANKQSLRFNDPRRFGCFLWSEQETAIKLLENLGVEPLTPSFSTKYFYDICVKRKAAIKQVIMDNHVVVGVGNIYAAESLFKSKLHPLRPANQLSEQDAKKLVHSIKTILRKAIKQGGTTLKDFQQADGKPGYFSQKLLVYGRGKQPCIQCDTELVSITLSQRATVYCPNCQS